MLYSRRDEKGARGRPAWAVHPKRAALTEPGASQQRLADEGNVIHPEVEARSWRDLEAHGVERRRIEGSRLVTPWVLRTSSVVPVPFRIHKVARDLELLGCLLRADRSAFAEHDRVRIGYIAGRPVVYRRLDLDADEVGGRVLELDQKPKKPLASKYSSPSELASGLKR